MYCLVVLGADEAWATKVAQRVRSAARSVLRHDALECRSDLPPEAEGSPVVVVCLGDERAAADDALAARLEVARDRAYGVLPVVHDLRRAQQEVPAALRRLNAMAWDADPSRVVQAVLALLGIAERERKLFLSYRRQETSALALQLRRELSERAYDVFLDRFSVPPGDDFQRRLDIELADKAFVLLLESESAVGSPWVQHEITYALSHRISVLALTLPDALPEARFEVVDDAFRMVLREDQLDAGRELRPGALAEVLAAVELRYARQLRQRRVDLLGSVSGWLDQQGHAPRQVADWAVASTGPGGRAQVWLTTPRAPVPPDLRELDRLRRSIGPACTGSVVHDTPVLDPDDRALIDWIIDKRPLQMVRLQAMPDLLAA